MIKKCKACGKPFISKTNGRIYIDYRKDKKHSNRAWFCCKECYLSTVKKLE